MSLKRFAEEFKELCIKYERMAAYFIIDIDDEGNPSEFSGGYAGPVAYMLAKMKVGEGGDIVGEFERQTNFQEKRREEEKGNKTE